MTRTFSKIYGLALVRLGWCYAPAGVADALNRIRGPFNVNGPAMAAGIAAIGDESHIAKAIAHNERWLPWLTTEIEKLGLKVTPSVGNFLLIHFPKTKGHTAAEADAFLAERGLILRAVGESHDAAHALGYKVVRIRVLAILFGGALAGMGGAYVSLIRVPQWTDGITAGAGWIALAIVVFASWKPWRVLLGAYLFGGITVLQLNLQAAGATIPVEYLSMSPYLITILVLVIMSSGKGKAALNAPASLGQNFHASR